MWVRDLMTPDPAVCNPDSDVRAAAQAMAERDCGALPVVSGGGDHAVQGILTDRDIAVRVVAEGRDPQQVKVAQVMTPVAVTVTPETTAAQAASLMESHKVRRLLVVEGQNCVGIVALADLVRESSAAESGQLVKEVSEPTSEPARL